MLYVDRPAWPARDRLWSHLVSDLSYAELHAFAELLGAPRRGFDRDHYDVPAERFHDGRVVGRPGGAQPGDRPAAADEWAAPTQTPRLAAVRRPDPIGGQQVDHPRHIDDPDR